MNTPSYNIAAIGPKELVSIFASAGIHAIEAQTSTIAIEAIEHMLSVNATGRELERTAIIFISESLLADMSHEVYKKLAQHTLPAIVSIPDLAKTNHFNERRLKDITRRAIGFEING